MAFQSTIYKVTGFGIPGEPYSNVQIWAQPTILNSGDAANNIFGNVFTFTGTSTAENVPYVQAGGTGPFAGFLINPKGSTTSGTFAGGSLAPTLTLPNYSTVEIAYQGEIIVQLTDTNADVDIGDLVLYNTTTGILTTIAPGATYPAGTLWANAWVNRLTESSPGLAVIKVDFRPTAPTAAP